MVFTRLYWIEGPWTGRLALAARPRGGDWLQYEMAYWRSEGVNTVACLLTSEEFQDLDLEHEAREVLAQGMTFVLFPIPDRQVPSAEARFMELIATLRAELAGGKSVVVHCRQGIGRSGLVAACLLVAEGWEPQRAVAHLSAVREVSVPETLEQRLWIDHFAA